MPASTKRRAATKSTAYVEEPEPAPTKPAKRAKTNPARSAEPLIVADAAAWKAWLEENEHTSTGVWLVLAKKGTTDPTSLTMNEALDEALASGFINGQGKPRDDKTCLSWYTPRTKASLWSQRNVDLVAALENAGRMRERGRAEVERAKANGRWARAYASPANATVPDDLQAALDASPSAKSAFAALKAQDRYQILFQLMTASSDALRQKRLLRAVGKLEAA